MSEQASPPATQPPAAKPEGNFLTRWFKGQSTFGKIRIIGIALLVVVGGPIAYFLAQSEPSAAKVGDCMNGQTAESMKKVDCTDASAEWVVVGRIEDKTEAQWKATDLCAGFPTYDTSYWEGEEGGTGFILCLEPK